MQHICWPAFKEVWSYPLPAKLFCNLPLITKTTNLPDNNFGLLINIIFLLVLIYLKKNMADLKGERGARGIIELLAYNFVYMYSGSLQELWFAIHWKVVQVHWAHSYSKCEYKFWRFWICSYYWLYLSWKTILFVLNA